MAPGCTSIQHEKDQKLVQFEVKNCSEFADLFSCTATNNQIPLPSPLPSSLFEDVHHKQQTSNFVVDQTKLTSQAKTTVASLTSANSLDTIDSFEILEQTIMKQKRISKMKNTDLRLKVLLKRTFNLVCEIMDHENGFDTDDVSESSEQPASETKEVSQRLNEQYDDEVDKDGEDSSDSDDDDDDDTESDSDEDDDYVQESINYSKVIPNKQENEISQTNDFQNIALKEYNFYELDENRYESLNKNQVLDKTTTDEHYMSLEPIVTYIEQQSISNKRKLSDDYEQEVYAKRFKSKRSLSSSSDDENEEKLVGDGDYQLESGSSSGCFILADQAQLEESSNNEPNFKLIIKSTDNNGYKLASINFYA